MAAMLKSTFTLPNNIIPDNIIFSHSQEHRLEVFH